jgi:hypothetical protein
MSSKRVVCLLTAFSILSSSAFARPACMSPANAVSLPLQTKEKVAIRIGIWLLQLLVGEVVVEGAKSVYYKLTDDTAQKLDEELKMLREIYTDPETRKLIDAMEVNLKKNDPKSMVGIYKDMLKKSHKDAQDKKEQKEINDKLSAEIKRLDKQHRDSVNKNNEPSKADKNKVIITDPTGRTHEEVVQPLSGKVEMPRTQTNQVVPSNGSGLPGTKPKGILSEPRSPEAFESELASMLAMLTDSEEPSVGVTPSKPALPTLRAPSKQLPESNQ